MAMPLVSIGLEEMIGITAMPSRHPPGQDVADALAKLLRENHVLTQELEESKEDVTMYEQVARDVETKWMLCEEVIGDLRSQVPRVLSAIRARSLARSPPRSRLRPILSVSDTSV